jgi:hypothetical protein
MTTSDSQNLPLRRAYVVRARPELSPRLSELGLADDIEFLSQPIVVMTEAVPFEGKLEGYRSLILRKCKEAFIADFLEFFPLSEVAHREALLGKDVALADAFDLWWIAEEVETIEIPTTW